MQICPPGQFLLGNANFVTPAPKDQSKSFLYVFV